MLFLNFLHTFSLTIMMCLLLSPQRSISTLPCVFEYIAKENLKSVTGLSHQEPQQLFTTDVKDLFHHELDRQLNSDEIIARRHLFTMFSNYEKMRMARDPSLCLEDDEFTPSNVLDCMTCQDMELLCGAKSNPGLYLAGQINSFTTAGKIMLLRMIAQPTVCRFELEKRQTFERALINSSEVFNELSDILQSLQRPIDVMISFSHDNFFKAFAYQHMIEIPGFKSLSDYLNKFSSALEINERLCQLRNIILPTTYLAASVIFPVLAVSNFIHIPYIYKFKKILAQIGIPERGGFYSILGIVWLFVDRLRSTPLTRSVSNSISTLTYSLSSYYGFDHIVSDYLLLLCLQEKLIHVAQILQSLKRIDELATEHPFLEKTSALKKIRHTLYELPTKVPQFGELIDILHKNTFSGNASILSRSGPILAGYRYVHELQNYFIEALVALGQLDAYVSVARLYKEHQGTETPYSFVEFDFDADHPYLQAEKFWNPLVTSQHVVTNSLSMGVKGVPRSVTIFGPNAGGKSTVLKAIIFLCIFAQSFGIGAAEYCVLTPFSKIMTYLNITDDIAAGNSHFKAGVLRAQQLLNTLDSLSYREWAFMAVDEVFDGTSAREAEAAAYSLIERLGKNPYALCLNITQFDLLADLEKQYHGKVFKNYKVTVAFDNCGHIYYPFKLEPGSSEQNVAFAILQQEGFGDEFIDRATSILEKRKNSI